jgi:hypothetical protein
VLDIIQTIHSILRWVVVLVAVIAVIKFAAGWLAKQSYRSMDRGLMSGFTGLMDLQLLLGVILFILWWVEVDQLLRFRLEHALTMILAVAVAHLAVRWRSEPDRIKFRNNLIAIVVSMLLVVVGVFILPQGWFG